MIRSAAEIQAEVLKAGRGMGLPLGLAEELALMARGMNGSALSRLISQLGTPEDKEVLAQMALDHALSAAPIETLPPRLVADADWADLSAMAALTYVPETVQSRTRGAGAGRIDND